MKYFIIRAGAMTLLMLGLVASSPAQKNKNKDQQGGTSLSSQPKPGETNGGAAVSKEEQAAYKAIYDARGGDAQNLVNMGEAFVMKYPDSVYAGGVYSDLASAYLKLNQPDKMVDAGNKALEKNPDDIDVLPLLAWAIPRRVNSSMSDASQQMQKAQGYAKHGIELISTMPKPADMDETVFTKAKNDKLALCHDGLGVVAVKTGKYDLASSELTQSIQLSSTPDPVDYYLLGVADEMGSHFTDAIAAFTKCASQGPMQGQCKAGLDDTKKKSQNSLEAPK